MSTEQEKSGKRRRYQAAVKAGRCGRCQRRPRSGLLRYCEPCLVVIRGHNKRRDAEKPKAVCSNCSELGHNVRTCTNPRDPRAGFCRAPDCHRKIAHNGRYCFGHTEQVRMGLPFGPIANRQRRATEDVKASIIAMRSAGLGPAEISRKLLVGRDTVYYVVNGGRKRDPDKLGPDIPEICGNEARCRCGLLLPCWDCIPTITEIAASRRGDAAGMVR